MSTFLLLNLTFVSVRMPDAATIPNSAMPAPPSTALGTPSTIGRDLGDQAEHDQDDARRRRDEARPDAGERDEADVLRECGVRERVEDAADDRAQAVGAQAVGELPARHRLVDDLADGDHVTGRLGHDHEADDSIDTIEATWKVGSPKWNGVISANQSASPTPDQSTIPGTNSAAIGAEHEPEQDRDALQRRRREALDER